MRTRPVQWMVRCLLGGAVAALAIWAHEGPEHEIEELTEQIRVQGERADLLVQRAAEYNILGKSAEAAKDLERALDLDAGSVDARRELSLAYTALGKTNEALATITRALSIRSEPPMKSALLMIRANLLRARKDFKEALRATDQAIQQNPVNVESYLFRSQLQALLQMHKERVQGLEEGLRQTGSGLLEGERVNALIEAGRGAEALPTIERELQRGRWRSSWLIRRARVRLATGEKTLARTDLEAALVELNQRLAGKSAEGLLLADRAMTYDLLGDKDRARAEYGAARDKGVTDEWLLARIEALKVRSE